MDRLMKPFCPKPVNTKEQNTIKTVILFIAEMGELLKT